MPFLGRRLLERCLRLALFSPATTWTYLMALCLQVKNKSTTSQQQVNHNSTTNQREVDNNLTTSRQRLTDQGVQVCGGGKSESVLSQFADTNLKKEKKCSEEIQQKMIGSSGQNRPLM